MTTTRINLIINTKMRIKDKNTKYAKQKFKWNVILTTYENLNMKLNEYMVQDHTLNWCWIN
jgi:hypothetical protein